MNTMLLILECGILLNSATTIGATDENPLQHRTESLTIALQGSVAAVTPLFGPVQEVEWAPGWKPQFIHPTEGAQRDGVVFRTIGTNGERLWTLTTYDEKAGRLDYVFIAPGCRPTTRSLGKCDQCSSDQGRSA